MNDCARPVMTARVGHDDAASEGVSIGPRETNQISRDVEEVEKAELNNEQQREVLEARITVYALRDILLSMPLFFPILM